MAGLLNLPPPKDAKPEDMALSPQAIRQKMDVDGAKAEQLDRIVLAGKKVMFSEQSHDLVRQQLEGPGSMRDKIGQGIAGLMGLLQQEAQGSLPGELLIPAGLILVAEAAAFLKDAGVEVPDAEVAGAMSVMVTAMLGAAGLDPEQVKAIGERGLKKPAGGEK